MKTLKGLIHDMIKSTEDLLKEIADLHSEAEIEDDVTKKVTDAVSAQIATAIADQLQTAVTAATADLNQKLTDQAGVIQAIADRLAGSDVAGATQLAVAAAPSDPAVTDKQAEEKAAIDLSASQTS